jgi:hypothetical protein
MSNTATGSRSNRDICVLDEVPGGGATRNVTSVNGVLESVESSTVEGKSGAGSEQPLISELSTIGIMKTQKYRRILNILYS